MTQNICTLVNGVIATDNCVPVSLSCISGVCYVLPALVHTSHRPKEMRKVVQHTYESDTWRLYIYIYIIERRMSYFYIQCAIYLNMFLYILTLSTIPSTTPLLDTPLLNIPLLDTPLLDIVTTTPKKRSSGLFKTRVVPLTIQSLQIWQTQWTADFWRSSKLRVVTTENKAMHRCYYYDISSLKMYCIIFCCIVRKVYLITTIFVFAITQ